MNKKVTALWHRYPWGLFAIIALYFAANATRWVRAHNECERDRGRLVVGDGYTDAYFARFKCIETGEHP